MQLSELENGNNESVIIIAGAGHKRGFLTAEITEALTQLASAFNVVFEVIRDSMAGIIELFESIKEFHEKNEEREYNREFHKLDFTRKKIVHQVMCRKPKHLVKKIIR